MLNAPLKNSANPIQHQVFASGSTIAPFNEWLIIPPADVTDADEEGHGTQVASKICGHPTVVSKKTTIILVKVGRGISNLRVWIRLWDTILRDT